MEDPYKSYILSDIQSRLRMRINYEDLPLNARILIKNAVLFYKKSNNCIKFK
jgi:hypothetical protein